jgi:hypothetical protein
MYLYINMFYCFSRMFPVRLPGLALSDRQWAVSDSDGTVTIADVWN